MSTIVGIDPGPRPGVVILRIDKDRVRDTYRVGRTPEASLAGWRDAVAEADLVALEAFVIGRGTVRKTKAGTVATLELIDAVSKACAAAGVRMLSFPAGVVKPWATDDRLRAYNCYVPGDHHRDAARHALFAAVRTGLLPRRPAP